MSISSSGIDFLTESLDGVRALFQQMGGLNIGLMFLTMTAILIYLLFKFVTERVS